MSTDTSGAYLTYYTTEFLRLRLALEHTESDVPELDGLDSAQTPKAPPRLAPLSMPPERRTVFP